MRFRVICLVACGAFVFGVLPRGAAQAALPVGNGAATPIGYPVTGRVICADTQRPARFAQVTLLPATSSAGEYDRGRRAIARTDLDGRFVMDNVAPGDYFAAAEMAGYVNETTLVQTALSAGGDASNALSSVPRVQVTAGGGSVLLSLQRGGVLAGAVQWDDGSPAAGVQVSAEPASTAASAQGNSPDQVRSGLERFLPSRFIGGQTDDRGRFRLSGLASGSYDVRVNLQSPAPGNNLGGGGRFPRLMTLRVYAPNKMRQSDATVYTVTAGEERGDIAVVLSLGSMHSVSGQVNSSGTAVHSGSVQLTDQTDSSLNRRAEINTDGSFTIPYVPTGNYSLRITASSQVPGPNRGGDDSYVRFQPVQESVTVADTDLTGVAVSVTPSAAASH